MLEKNKRGKSFIALFFIRVCAKERGDNKIKAIEIFFIVFDFWKCKLTNKYLDLRSLGKKITFLRRLH
jgi:hypothetical protein